MSTAGGSKTTQNGKQFEHCTNIQPLLLQLGFEQQGLCLQACINGTKFKFTSKKDFKRMMREDYQLEMTREPDEAFVLEPVHGNKKILKVLEKKYQSQEGSVDDKLLAGDGIRRQYHRDVGDQFEIEYAFCVNDFIKTFLHNNKGKHTHFYDIVTQDYTIPVFFGEDSDYFQRLGNWLGLSNIPRVEPQMMFNPLKPFLKWVGGKQKLLKTVLDSFPREMNQYHEPFLGGGSVLLGVLSAKAQGWFTIRGEIYASDANEPLIWVYKNIQTRPNEVQRELQVLVDAFKSKAMPEKTERSKKGRRIISPALDGNREEYYYWVRSTYNQLEPSEKCSPRGSALLWFMNKTCHKGEFRMGPHGYNVPYGNPGKNIEIFNETHLHQVHRLIQGVHFEYSDFSQALQRAQPGDFIYLDPPYASPQPDKTGSTKSRSAKSFVGYTQNGFPSETSVTLFREIHRLTKMGVGVSLSNADIEFVRKHFPPPEYRTQEIVCKSAIHSKNPGEKRLEVLITSML
jgi:DNA adenine methylase